MANRVERVTSVAAIKRPARLGEEVYELLLGQLMSLKIAPGARITIDTLAREFGLSQTPIREAMSKLEAEGLVIKTHLIGYSAAPQLDKQQFEELYELRLMIEPPSAARAAERGSPSAIDEIAELTETMAASVRAEPVAGYGRFAQTDEAFHNRVLAASGNNIVRETLARLHVHLQLFRLLYHPRVTAEAVNEHADIVAAIKAHDASAAEQAMRRHIERSFSRFIGIFDGR